MKRTEQDEIVLSSGELVRIGDKGLIIRSDVLEEIRRCQRCSTERLMYLRAYDFGGYAYRMMGDEETISGDLPDNLGQHDDFGDLVLIICLECGQLQGIWPVATLSVDLKNDEAKSLVPKGTPRKKRPIPTRDEQGRFENPDACETIECANDPRLPPLLEHSGLIMQGKPDPTGRPVWDLTEKGEAMLREHLEAVTALDVLARDITPEAFDKVRSELSTHPCHAKAARYIADRTKLDHNVVQLVLDKLVKSDSARKSHTGAYWLKQESGDEKEQLRVAAVLAALPGSQKLALQINEVSLASEVEPDKARKILDKLKEQGVVTYCSHGWYRTASGDAALRKLLGSSPSSPSRLPESAPAVPERKKKKGVKTTLPRGAYLRNSSDPESDRYIKPTSPEWSLKQYNEIVPKDSRIELDLTQHELLHLVVTKTPSAALIAKELGWDKESVLEVANDMPGFFDVRDGPYIHPTDLAKAVLRCLGEPNFDEDAPDPAPRGRKWPIPHLDHFPKGTYLKDYHYIQPAMKEWRFLEYQRQAQVSEQIGVDPELIEHLHMFGPGHGVSRGTLIAVIKGRPGYADHVINDYLRKHLIAELPDLKNIFVITELGQAVLRECGNRGGTVTAEQPRVPFGSYLLETLPDGRKEIIHPTDARWSLENYNASRPSEARIELTPEAMEALVGFHKIGACTGEVVRQRLGGAESRAKAIVMKLLTECLIEQQVTQLYAITDLGRAVVCSSWKEPKPAEKKTEKRKMKPRRRGKDEMPKHQLLPRQKLALKALYFAASKEPDIYCTINQTLKHSEQSASTLRKALNELAQSELKKGERRLVKLSRMYETPMSYALTALGCKLALEMTS